MSRVLETLMYKIAEKFFGFDKYHSNKTCNEINEYTLSSVFPDSRTMHEAENVLKNCSYHVN